MLRVHKFNTKFNFKLLKEYGTTHPEDYLHFLLIWQASANWFPADLLTTQLNQQLFIHRRKINLMIFIPRNLQTINGYWFCHCICAWCLTSSSTVFQNYCFCEEEGNQLINKWCSDVLADSLCLLNGGKDTSCW